MAQPPEKWGEGEIEKVEIQITKEKQITLATG
jgi:glucan biosynthesis protein